MARMRVLIAVKTYPTLSEKYDELVCTAGFREDGSWIRIYPIPFRKLGQDSQYKKWQWVDIDLQKNTSDRRMESYRPADINADILTGEVLDTADNWAKRKPYALREVYDNLDALIAESKVEPYKSLAVVKPKRVIDFVCEPVDREWDYAKLKAIYYRQLQPSLFNEDNQAVAMKVVRKLPYKFSYVFTTEDGKDRQLMIEDWELGMLYWNCLKQCDGDEQEACRLVRQKYFVEMVQGRDFHFFVGTTKSFHWRAPNPYIIIGTFWPKLIQEQPTLFD